MAEKEQKYLNQSLLEGLQVFEKFLLALSPFAEYSVQSLSESFAMEYSKMFRIIKTLHHAGFIESSNAGKTYCVSKRILQLPLRYLHALKAEHERIKLLVNSFDFHPEDEPHDGTAIQAQPGKAGE